MSRIKDIPYCDRPREKALRFGIESLSDAELLALIIQSGGKDNSAIDIANAILKFSNQMYLIEKDMNFFTSIKGISKVKALHLLSIFEFVKRYEMRFNEHDINTINIHSLARKYRFYFMKKRQEQLILVMLDYRSKIIKEEIIYKGNETYIDVDINQLLRKMKVNKAYKACLIHNHPSGEVIASKEDEHTNTVISEAFEENGYKLLDHLIIGKNNYYSFNEMKKMLY